MKPLRQSFVAQIAAVVVSAATLAAQSVVAGTGDPNVDVPAVQAAVDQGGHVVLTGHFSFDKPPIGTVGGTTNLWMILVSKEVIISGAEDEHGEMTTVAGGEIPFYVESPGVHVTIQGLHFVRPKREAIVVASVSGLVIADCRIEGVVAERDPANPGGNPLGAGIFVGTTNYVLLSTPTLAQPGQPENISGNILIVNNDIDIQGMTGTVSLGIFVPSIGKSPDREVDLYITGNNIRNTTERAINVYLNDGRAYIERNVIKTGAIMRPGAGITPLIDAIHALRYGSYLIAHNSIDTAWANGAGIRLGENGGTGAIITHAMVVDNDVSMSAPAGTVFGNESAGIEIRGYAQGNVVLNNSVRGRATTALSALGSGVGIPVGNAFSLNDYSGLKSSLADVLIGEGVVNTLVAEPDGTKIADHGTGTRIVALSNPAPTLYELRPGVVAAQDASFNSIGQGNPAQRGQPVILYAGGLGPLSNQGGLSVTTSLPMVSIGALQAPVLFSGLTPGYPLLYQINIVIPQALSPGNYPITIVIRDRTSNASGIEVQ